MTARHAEVHAEDVHLEHVPPLVDRDLPRGPVLIADPCVRRRGGRSARAPSRSASTHASTSSRLRDVADEREPADLGCDRVHLLGVRAVTATRMPASASSRAIEAPIPRPPPVTSATPSSGSDGTRDLLQRLRVLERREVARILPERSRPHGAADDLRAARLRERGDEDDPIGRERLAELVATAAATSSASVASAPGASTQKSQATSPFTSCGTPIAAASATAGWFTAADSSSAGPMRLPAMFSVSSERPWRNQ